MKKIIVLSVALSALTLTACGESEKKVDDSPKQELVSKSDTKIQKKVELPKVIPLELKKPNLNNGLFVKAKKDLMSGVKGTQAKAKKSILEAKEKGLTFTVKTKEEVLALKGLMKDEYAIQLKDNESAIKAVEMFLSDKYDGQKKQSFYFSEIATTSSIGFIEAQFDDLSKEMKFVVRDGAKWTVFETKAEADKRIKKMKDYLAKKKLEKVKK
jgi:hypothetical protein